MLLSVLGRVTWVSLVQSAKVESSMDLRESGRVMEVR